MKKSSIFSVVAGITLAITSTNSFSSIITADYRNLGTFTTPTLNTNGITVSGSSDINVLNLNGLGIVGGYADNTVDTNEFIQFDFTDSTTTGVNFFIQVAGNTNSDDLVGERFLEAFDVSGTSLGSIVQTGAGHYDLTSLYNGVAISSFILTSPGYDLFRVASVSYSAVPVPAAIWLFASGLSGLLIIGRRRIASS